jgi:hypothetical protein
LPASCCYQRPYSHHLPLAVIRALSHTRLPLAVIRPRRRPGLKAAPGTDMSARGFASCVFPARGQGPLRGGGPQRRAKEARGPASSGAVPPTGAGVSICTSELMRMIFGCDEVAGPGGARSGLGREGRRLFGRCPAARRGAGPASLAGVRAGSCLPRCARGQAPQGPAAPEVAKNRRPVLLAAGGWRVLLSAA